MKRREADPSRELEVYRRLASLDEATQERISVKYYHGTRPWKVRREGAKAPDDRGRKAEEAAGE